MKEAFEAFKAACEKITAGTAPWWCVPLSVAVVLAIIL